MMGLWRVDQAALSYEFSLERHGPASHLLRSIHRFVDLSADVVTVIVEAPARNASTLCATSAGTP